MKYFFILIGLWGCFFVAAQETEEETTIGKCITDIKIYFRHDKSVLDLEYMGNETSLHHFSHKIDSIGISHIDSVVVISYSSPEGNYAHNLRLSENRVKTMYKYILNNHPKLIERLHVYPSGESWDQLREYVKKDTLINHSDIEKVLAIIDAKINIETKKEQIQQLPIYHYLLRTYYPRIRKSSYYIFYNTETVMPKLATITINSTPSIEVMNYIPKIEKIEKKSNPQIKEWNRKLHVKTNVIGLGMAIANVAAEVDLAKHWSFTLPIYYSAWDYFKNTIKFRTLAIQPEFRYWISDNNDGFFAGAHFGMAYYNYAFDGSYRYQDHNRETPAIGGGLSIGYRLPISKNNRWRIEFSLGAGVYPLHYDKFHNTTPTKDGLIIESIKKTYWGIDQAAVSFSYSFDLKKRKGGKR